MPKLQMMSCAEEKAQISPDVWNKMLWEEAKAWECRVPTYNGVFMVKRPVMTGVTFETGFYNPKVVFDHGKIVMLYTLVCTHTYK